MSNISKTTMTSLLQTTLGAKSLGGGQFIGRMESAPSGPGTASFLFRDHREIYDGPSMKYDGEWNRGGRHGQGASAGVSGTQYRGQYIHDKRHGAGKERFHIGASYDGGYSEGIESGHGTAISVDGSEYTGDFKNGLRDGTGTLQTIDGCTYTGDYVQGLRHGHGKYEWADGQMYDGEYQNDRRHGQGVYSWPDGRKYFGEFQNNCRSGEGEFTFPSGDKFVGKYESDRRSGHGAMYYASGEVDRGGWRGQLLVQVEQAKKGEKSGPQTHAGNEFLEASKSGDTDAVMQLINSGTVAIDASDSEGRTALYFAALNGDCETMQTMLSEGARINLLTTSGASVVSHVYATSGARAVEPQQLEKLRKTVIMLLDEGANPNVSTNPTPIIINAIKRADIEMVQKLIVKGADLEYSDSKRHRTALHHAGLHYATCERIDRILSNWRVSDGGGEAVDTTVTADALAVAVALIDAGADVTAMDVDGLTILHIAAGVKGEAVSTLLDKIFMGGTQVDVNGVWRDRQTPLSITVAAGNDALAFELLDRGADPNTKLQQRVVMCTLLHENGHKVRNATERLALAKELIVSGADLLVLVPYTPTKSSSAVASSKPNAVGLMIDQVYADCQSRPKDSGFAGHDKALLEALLDGIRACHHKRHEENKKSIPFCYECGRSRGVKLHSLKTSPVVCFCSDRCEMRALNRGHLKWCSAIEGAVKWRPVKTKSKAKPDPLAFKTTGHFDEDDRDATLRKDGSKVSELKMTRSTPLPNIGSGYVSEANPPKTYRAVKQLRVPGIGPNGNQ